MMKNNYKQDLSIDYITKNVLKYIPKYIAINFPDFYYMKNDITNDIFLKMVTKGKFNPEKGKISTYLTNICRYHIIDLIRNKKKRKEKGFIYIDKFDTFDNYNQEYCEMEDLDEIDLQKHIEIIFNNLTRVERYIAEQKFILNKKHKEIYTHLQIDVDKFNRYFKKLKVKLKDVFLNDEVIINYMIVNNIRFEDVIK